jgi:hypothetical protein
LTTLFFADLDKERWNESLLAATRSSFPETPELHKMPGAGWGTDAEQAAFATDVLVASYPALRSISLAALSPHLMALYKRPVLKREQSGAAWHSVFAADVFQDEPLLALPTAKLVKAASKLSRTNSSWRFTVQNYALCGCVVTVSRAVLPFISAMARSSKTVRRRLANDLEFLDFIGVQLVDSCLLIALDVPLDSYPASMDRIPLAAGKVQSLTGLFEELRRRGKKHGSSTRPISTEQSSSYPLSLVRPRGEELPSRTHYGRAWNTLRNL